METEDLFAVPLHSITLEMPSIINYINKLVFFWTFVCV